LAVGEVRHLEDQLLLVLAVEEVVRWRMPTAFQ
jgi:hypothetical protein